MLLYVHIQHIVIWLKYTVTWIHATWCSSNTPVPMSLDCNKKSCDMKQDMSTTKSTEQFWSQLYSLTFHYHCCRQLCLCKRISTHNCVGSSILWTYTQDINGNITKIMVCLDPVGTLDSSTIEVPFNLDGGGKCFTNYRFQHCYTCADINMFRIWQRNDSCVLEWQLCYAMTAVLCNDSCVMQWQLCCAMAAVLRNGSCLAQWQLCCAMADVLRNGRCVAKWQLCCAMVAVLRNGSCIAQWQLCCAMADVLRNGSCVMQWQLCYRMTAVLRNDSCVMEWQLCYGMTAVLHNDSCVTLWHYND